MLINPDDRRLGNRRQAMTRARIDSMIDDDRRRRRGMSRFARTGQERAPRARRTPFRGAASGIRSMASPRAGGLAQFLQNRGPGRGVDARTYIEPPETAAPRVMPPPMPRPLSLPSGPTSPVASPDILRDLLGGGGMSVSPSSSVGTHLDYGGEPEFFDIDLGGGPTSSLAGLLPLGHGTWFDPAAGTLYGPGGRSNLAI